MSDRKEIGAGLYGVEQREISLLTRLCRWLVGDDSLCQIHGSEYVIFNRKPVSSSQLKAIADFMDSLKEEKK